MEHKQFICDDLQNYSPHSSQSFQADRFAKKTIHLNIPDTIPENSSAELSGESLKMEAPILTEVFNEEDKKIITLNEPVACNESLNTSTIVAIDNSYIKQCERKLLENSSSEDEKSMENKCLVDKHLLDVPRMSAYPNDTISTPPSLLRKEISLLRNEMAEAHEFHDFEIQLLKEEKFQTETDSYNYSEIISKMTEKYSALMDLYTNLKVEYEDYRSKQEHMRQEIQSKTADCLESLCSQIETSDNSLNFSSASFASFNGGIKSSTMMEDITEVEATILHDATVLANDPLSITNEGMFKTPMQTPLKSAKKLFSQESIVKEVQDIIANRDTTIPLDSEYNIQLLNLETALYDKIKEVEDLEQRLFKVEDLSSVLQTEVERIAAQNNALKENLIKKTEQFNELTQKLFTETISLKPSLRDSLVDIPGTKLLFVFIETIMESCRKIQTEEITKHNHEKSEWEAKSKEDSQTIENLKNQLSSKLAEVDDLEKKLSDIENLILTRDEEILKLQSQVSNVRQAREDFASAREALSDLESRLTLTEAEKAAAENRYRELETVLDSLKREVETNKNIQKKLEVENFEMKNEIESQNVLKTELMTVKEKLSSAEEALEKLKFQIESEKAELENRCEELKNFRTENDTLKQRILESEKASKELEKRLIELQIIPEEFKSQIQALESEKLELENRCAELENIRIESEEVKQQSLEMEKTLVALESRCTDFENIKTENNNLKEQIVEMEKTSEELKSQLQSLESKKLEVENRCKELENNQTELKFKLESIESEKFELENHCTELENIQIENNNLRERIFEIEKTSEELKSRTQTLESKKFELESRCTELENIQKENDNLKQQIFEIGKTTEESKSQLETLESEKFELENQYTELQNAQMEIKFQLESLKSAKLQLENIRIENNTLKQQISEIEKASAELKSQLQSVESEKLEMENRCVELQNILTQNDDLKQRIFESEKLELENRCTELENIRIENNNLKRKIVETEKASVGFKSQIQSLELEKAEMENRCLDLQNFRIENDTLRQQVFEFEKASTELKTELELRKEDEVKSKNKIEDLFREIEQFKKNNCEIVDAVEEIQNKLTDLMSGYESNELPSERITKLVENSNFQETKIVSIFIQTIRNTCEGVQNELLRNFDSKKLDWEAHLQILHKEIKALTESRDEREAKILEINLEKEDLLKSQESLKNRIIEAEKIISEGTEEMKTLKQTAEAMLELKSQLTLALSKKEEIEIRCRELEEENQLKIKAIMKDLEEKERELVDAVKIIADREEEVRILQEQQEGMKNRQQELEQIINKLKEEIETKENLKIELSTKKSEIIHLKESYGALKAQMTEAENTITSREEEIRLLKAYKTELSTIKENLASADETILSLKSQLKSVEIEKSQMENRCTELENNSNYEKIQTENDDLKQRIYDSDKMLTELKNELEIAKEDQKNIMTKVEELIREIEELKRENDGFSNALVTIEETQRNLADVLSEEENDSDLLGDRITKLIAKTSKPETKIVSDLVETITKTCKGVQNKMIKKFDSKKLEWDVDLRNLHEQIKTLTEANNRQEAVLCQTKNELVLADERIGELKSQLTSAEIKKEEAVNSLKIEIDTKETIIKGLDEMKILREKIENENCCLRQQLQESDDLVVSLKKQLTTVEEERNVKETTMQELVKEIDLLQKEMDFISQKLEKVEKSNRNLMEVLSDLQTLLNISDDILTNRESRKIFSERLNEFVKTKMEGLETENKNLKLGNENLKEEIKQLTKLIGETASKDLKDHLANVSASHPNRTKTGKNIDLCVRRLDKLEEINLNLTELLTRILSMTEFPDLEKLKLCSVREFPTAMKKVVAHMSGLLAKMKEMKEENGQLDEECETYANIIKDLKKEAAVVWKNNKEKTEAMEAEVERLKKEKNALEKEKEDLAGKISKLNEECFKLKTKTEGTHHTCNCGNETKKINELKRAILVKEQKLLELQDLEVQTNSYKSQIEYLKTALEREKKKIGEEKEKNKKLQNELKEAMKNQITDNKKPDESQVLDELRMRGSISGGIVQDFVDKEKMRKLSKDIGILKELCRARYAEIKRLEAVNAALRNGTPKNSNQMDSPIRSRGYNTRSKNQVRDFWRTEISGKENSAV